MSVKQVVMAAAGALGGAGAYIEDVFSTYLFRGADSNTITVDIGMDLTVEDALVWHKCRGGNAGVQSHALFDTLRGSRPYLSTNTTSAQTNTIGANDFAFTSTGYQFGPRNGTDLLNASTSDFVSWTFRKAPKFFDVVTYTGNGVAGRAINHNLDAVPGVVIVKRTDSVGNWITYHRSLGNTKFVTLESTAAAATSSAAWDNTSPTSTQFTVGSAGSVNADGGTYVAYLFAHDAGGFGDAGDQNVISCGSFTNSGSTVDVNLGYEAQFVLIKKSSGTGNWFLFDTMRGLSQTSFEFLYPNLSNTAEPKTYQGPFATATGFSFNPANNGQFTTGDYIYIAVRRGPMKTPTDGTSVFSAQTYTGSGSTTILDASIVPDIYMGNTRTPAGGPVGIFVDRMRGNSKYIRTYDTAAEAGTSPSRDFYQQTQFTLTSTADNVSGRTYVSWFMRRAPGFFDVVCYTGDGAARTINHNLGVAPELIIVKVRSGYTYGWYVYDSTNGAGYRLRLDDNGGTNPDTSAWNDTAPTSSVFSVGNAAYTNGSIGTYVAYLFASCPGVSKVGSYTGTGTTLQINCGFSAGARFVLIKRTDSTGDWYVWDSARGIVAGNDPYLLLNSTAAEVTSTDYVDTYSAGFEISSTAPAAINANGGTFIFLAIA